MIDSDKVRNIVASVLTQRRVASNLTQQELSEKAGIERSYISLIENGERLPGIEVVFRIAYALGLRARTLVAEVEEQYRNEMGYEKKKYKPRKK